MPTRALRPRVTLAQLAIASAAMGSGGALVVTILTHAALWLTLTLFTLYAVTITAFFRALASAETRARILHRMRVGAVAGIFSTLAYDATRLVLVETMQWTYWPFETFVLFGRSIAGADLSRPEAYAVGTAYHCVNGILFAIAYACLFGGRHWAAGIAFALVLEATVYGLYPTWLNLNDVMGEFTVVSLMGHTAYGATLGLICARYLGDRLPFARSART